jgi:AraC-like DNA-binding protein
VRVEAVPKSQPPGYRNTVRGYEQFYLILVLEGVLYFCDDRDTVAIRPGQMVALRPGSSFALHTESHGYSGVAVEVRPPLRNGRTGRSLVIERSERIHTLGEWLQDELSLPRTGSTDVVSHLAGLLVELSVREGGDRPPGEPRLARSAYWARRVHEAIENSIYTARSVREVLESFPVSYRQLSRFLVAEYGASPKEVQLAARMREARRLLEETSWSVTTIALELGFSSTQHFSAVFAAREGRSPGRWRAGR